MATIHVDITPAFGPYFWGFVAANVFSGISLVQAYRFFNTSKDKWPLKLFVSVLVTLDVCMTVIVAQPVYYYLVTNYGNPLALLEWTKVCGAHTFLNVIFAFIVQMFFASRIYIIRKKKIMVPFIVVFFSSLALICGIVLTVISARHPRLVDMGRRDLRIATGLSSGFSTVADVASTIAMCLSLHSARSTIRRTNDLINHLLFVFIQRTVLVSVVQILFFAFFSVVPFNFWWLPFYLVISKVYACTSFAILNSRDKMRSKLDTTVVFPVNLNTAPKVPSLGSTPESQTSLPFSSRNFATSAGVTEISSANATLGVTCTVVEISKV